VGTNKQFFDYLIGRGTTIPKKKIEKKIHGKFSEIFVEFLLNFFADFFEICP
jgi:hypothetical protein